MGRCFGVLLFLAGAAGAQCSPVTWTGWFSDIQCATARASQGLYGPTNPECAKTCIQDGKAPVFISEQSKAIYKVTGYSGVVDDLGYHVEVTADLNSADKTISIRSVKRLSYEGAACQRKK
jgi:hypothetical protein